MAKQNTGSRLDERDALVFNGEAGERGIGSRDAQWAGGQIDNDVGDGPVDKRKYTRPDDES